MCGRGGEEEERRGFGIFPFENDTAFMCFISLFFMFSFFFFLKMFLLFLSFCISLKYVSLLALVSNFNCRCFLRSRRSMEMWCPDYDYATCNLSFTSVFAVLDSGHFIWTTLKSMSCFLVFPRSRLKRQSQCVNISLLVSARVLDDFQGISCFVIFNVTRAILETLPSHMHLVALLSQRAAVKSRLTQQRVVLWLRRLHELANPWKRFKSLVMF